MSPTSALSASWQGTVMQVYDGDTLKVKPRNILRYPDKKRGVRIRLAEIDTPERGQPYANRAKRFTTRLTLGKKVTVEEKEWDRYGRMVAHIVLPDGKNLSQELLKSGHAWWNTKYSRDKALQAMEKKAKNRRIGLWKDPTPVAPWIWKRYHRR
ncbi:MAG: thermonuclease family protein [Magnetococcales bacterium]|nr:thermonuclease family protein [Magnetococcales bacterium]